jgi:hydrogenase maturation factor HypF (carbamoyltransferase family)
MIQYVTIHPDNPQERLLQKAVAVVRQGGVIALPTDSSYALGCHLGDKAAVERIRSLRGVDDRHHLTLMCRDLSQIGQFARVDKCPLSLAEGDDAGQLHLHPRRHPGIAAARPAPETQDHRLAQFRRTRSRWRCSRPLASRC